MKKLCALLTLIIVLCLPTAVPTAEQENLVTRAEFVKELITQAGIETEEVTQSSFLDVTDPEFIPYLETAYKNGIVTGYDGCFDPDRYVTKEEAVKIIVEVFGEKAGFNEIAKTYTGGLEFTDSESIAVWAKPYIAYALEAGLITEEGDAFGPRAPVTAEQAGEMTAAAKEVYQRLFTRDGMSAPDMLVHINQRIAEAKTYKQKGTVHTGMELLVEDVTQEQMEENEELKAFLDGGMEINMIMDMDVSVQTPDKIYIRQSVVSDTEAEEVVQDVETFMDGSLIYTRMTGTDKWILQDLSSAMEQIQPITDREPCQMAQLSEDELKMFKEFAKYEADAELDGKEYYLISFDIDKETYRKYYMEVMEKVMDSVVTLQSENPKLSQDPDFDPQQYKQIMTALVSGIEVELSYRYYINKETKLYERVWMSQDMTMPMTEYMTAIEESLDGDGPPFSVKMLIHSEGEYEIYGFDEEAEFPVITEEDIIDERELVPVETKTLQ